MERHDKRREPRIPTMQRVWVEGQDVRCEGEAHNMSSRGMFVVAKTSAPQVGSTLDIKFEDPLEGAIALKMEVVWRDEATVNAKVGLKIADPNGSSAFQRVVARYTRERERTQGDGAQQEAVPAPEDATDASSTK